MEDIDVDGIHDVKLMSNADGIVKVGMVEASTGGEKEAAFNI